MSAPRCGDCRYLHREGDERLQGVAVGDCRRRAPSVGQYHPPAGPALWPIVALTSWCGEFQPAMPGPIEERVDPVAAAAADVAEFIKDRIALCGHGSIAITCGPCMAPWLPR